VLTQKPLDGLLHKFKDICQIGAAVKFLVEILRSSVVQTLNTPGVQYLDWKRSFKFCEGRTFIYNRKECSIVANLSEKDLLEVPLA